MLIVSIPDFAVLKAETDAYIAELDEELLRMQVHRA